MKSGILVLQHQPVNDGNVAGWGGTVAVTVDIGIVGETVGDMVGFVGNAVGVGVGAELGLLNGFGADPGQESPSHLNATPGIVSAWIGKLNVAPLHESGWPEQITDPFPFPKLNWAFPLHDSPPSQTIFKSLPVSPLKWVIPPHDFNPIQLTVNVAFCGPIICASKHAFSAKQFTVQSYPGLLHSIIPSLHESLVPSQIIKQSVVIPFGHRQFPKSVHVTCIAVGDGVGLFVGIIGVGVGAGVGFPVGAGVGAVVGLVGFVVGTSVGDFVGLFVGANVGFPVGSDVGDMVGFVGDWVGSDVGDGVGLFVGAGVGDMVGLVGSGVGDGVGLFVGVGVGLDVGAFLLI